MTSVSVTIMTDSPAPAGADQGPEDLRSDTTKKKSAGRDVIPI